MFNKKIAARHPRRGEACLARTMVHHGLQVKRAGRAQPLRDIVHWIRNVLKGVTQIMINSQSRLQLSTVGVQFIAPAMVSAAQSAMNCAPTMEAHS
jgi:hypothetical protein